MTFSLKPHEKGVNKKGYEVMTRLNPYIRLNSEDGKVAIFIQGGRYYTDNGEEMKLPPPWVKAALSKISDKCKREVGLGGDSSN